MGAPRVPRILYLEDDLELSMVVRQGLELDGYQIVWVPDGDQAAKLLKVQAAEFDLLLLDQNVGGCCGIDCAAVARATGFAGPILLMSGQTELIRDQQVACGGLFRLVAKPTGIFELLRICREVLPARPPQIPGLPG